MATVVFSQQLRTKETTHIHTFLTRNTIENCIFARLFPIRSEMMRNFSIYNETLFNRKEIKQAEIE